MTTPMRLLPVRVSPALRGLIDQVGPVNPATRALLVLGAAAAGLELRGLEREVALLLGAELAPEVRAALRQLFGSLTGREPIDEQFLSAQLAPPFDDSEPTADPPDDPFAGVGIDV